MTGLWRWRRNPLRRTTDLVEAWVALAACVLIALGAPAAGWFSASRLDASLQRTARVERHDRHRVTAVMVADSTEHSPYAFYDPDATPHRDTDTRLVARWTAPGGGKHLDTVTAPRTELRPGDGFPIWTDARGDQAPPPMNAAVARFHAVFSGFVTACVAACLVTGAWRVALWRILSRRYRRLDRQWAQAGPDWGRTGTGS